MMTCPRGDWFGEAFIMGEIGHVLARADFRGNFQRAREKRLRPVESTSKSGCRPWSHGACASVSSASRNPFPSTRSTFARARTRFTPSSSARSSNSRSKAGRGAL